MKRNITLAIAAIMGLGTWASCSKSIPVDSDGMLITTRRECSVSSFELLGTDFVSVRAGAPVIDTVARTITCTVQFGTDLHNLYPQFTLAQDCKLDPKITGLTDFSDLAHPRQWTVVSGDRQIRKTYTVTLTVQPR